jgi:hypothetical protein
MAFPPAGSCDDYLRRRAHCFRSTRPRRRSERSRPAAACGPNAAAPVPGQQFQRLRTTVELLPLVIDRGPPCAPCSAQFDAQNSRTLSWIKNAEDYATATEQGHRRNLLSSSGRSRSHHELKSAGRQSHRCELYLRSIRPKAPRIIAGAS